MAALQTIFGIWFKLLTTIFSPVVRGVDLVLETLWSGILKLAPLTSKIPIDPASLSQWNVIQHTNTNDKVSEWIQHIRMAMESREVLKMERWNKVRQEMNRLEETTMSFMERNDIHYRDFLKYVGLLSVTCKSVCLYALAETNYKYTISMCDVVGNNSPTVEPVELESEGAFTEKRNSETKAVS